MMSHAMREDQKVDLARETRNQDDAGEVSDRLPEVIIADNCKFCTTCDLAG